HYAPTMQEQSDIEPGMVVLIDAWARSHTPASIYADITWVGYTGDVVPDDVAHRFDVIVRGRDAAADLVRSRFASGTPVYGYEVDRACRNVIEQAGLGHLFIHRTGHSITDEVHGPGTNIDDFETHDTRRILPGTTFSIEPGVYEEDILGLRTEIDIVVDHDGSVSIPSAPVQMAVLPLLAEEDPCRV
ncbi:MAG: aminopeptidase P family protein, partial [Candidatus Kapabacteria bacterium]|nr:aminopeptidase P family protein [Candidatus Kapabacteria bacterium]